jgi:hypothetical protein
LAALVLRLRGHLTFANVVSVLALFVALGGSSYAALRIGSGQIRDDSVRSVDLRDNTVRSLDLRDNGVRGVDVRANSLTGADIKESLLGRVPAAVTAHNAEMLDGKDASDFGPRAYALVDRQGSVDAASSRGLTSANVSHPSDGVYCFSGLNFVVSSVTATVEAHGSTGAVDDLVASTRARPDLFDSGADRFDPQTGEMIPGPYWPENCPGTEQASVVITDAGLATRPGDGTWFAFYVVFN